jgi:hypothetical protein
MTLSTVAHDTFVIERTYDAPVAEVFRAWADPILKARWFAGSAEALGAGYELDFRIGGRETNRGWTSGWARLHVRVPVPRHRPRAADRPHERNVWRRVSNLGIRHHGPIRSGGRNLGTAVHAWSTDIASPVPKYQVPRHFLRSS